MAKIKVLIVNTFYPPSGYGGAEKSVQTLAEGLGKINIDVTVLTTSQEPFSETINNVKIISFGKNNVFWLGKPSSKKFLKLIWHFIDLFNLIAFFKSLIYLIKNRPNIIHTNNITGFSPSILIAAKILNIKIVHTLRDYYLASLRSNAEGNQIIDKWLKIIAKLSSHCVNAVVGNSEYILNWHISKNYFKNSEASVIFNAYNPPDEIKPKAKSNDDFIYGFIGKLSFDKGVENLCNEFLAFLDQSKFKNYKLLIAGIGDETYTNFLKEKYKHKNIIFLGYVNQNDFYRSIDWCISPSLWEEPLSRVCFESKFYGVPIISSSRGGNPEVIVDSINGLIFDHSEKNAICNILKKSITMPYDELSKNALRDSKNFVVSRMVADYLEVYKKLNKIES